MKIILAAHGKFAQELLASANMVYGQIDNLNVITFLPGENTETLKTKYREIISGCQPEEEILFLVDLFGGSPYNAAFEIAIGEERIEVLTGLSLPMLIETSELREMQPGIKAAEVYENLSRDSYMKSCRMMLKESNDEKEEEDEL